MVVLGTFSFGPKLNFLTRSATWAVDCLLDRVRNVDFHDLRAFTDDLGRNALGHDGHCRNRDVLGHDGLYRHDLGRYDDTRDVVLWNDIQGEHHAGRALLSLLLTGFPLYQL